jgi:glycosyltransferase involved in cell wall biosynthesis
MRDTLGVTGPVTVSRNPISLWSQPIDWAAKRPGNLLFVGRIEHRKGLQVLLSALDGLGEEADGLVLRVVGHKHPPTRELDRRCLEDFEAHLLSHSAPKRGTYTLEYAGPCGHQELHRHYDWAGVQVLPSLMENYPYTALEGLSRGCFLLGSDAGGIPEIIDRPGRGMLFASENSTQLAGKIRECRRRDRAISDGMREIAEEIRSEFEPEACYLRLMETYGANLPQRDRRQGLPEP